MSAARSIRPSFSAASVIGNCPFRFSYMIAPAERSIFLEPGIFQRFPVGGLFRRRSLSNSSLAECINTPSCIHSERYVFYCGKCVKTQINEYYIDPRSAHV
jgi:hypothetical protein